MAGKGGGVAFERAGDHEERLASLASKKARHEAGQVPHNGRLLALGQQLQSIETAARRKRGRRAIAAESSGAARFPA